MLLLSPQDAVSRLLRDDSVLLEAARFAELSRAREKIQ